MLLWTRAMWKMQTACGHQAAKCADETSAPALPACTQPCSGHRGVSGTRSYLPIFAAGIVCRETFAVYSSNIWGPFYLASCALAASMHGHGCCSLAGKALVDPWRIGTKPCGTNISWRNEQREGGIRTFEKLSLHVRQQMMILLMLPVLFIALFQFKVYG